jgi:transcriptional/translational regulatory protein YebC/TACO1
VRGLLSADPSLSNAELSAAVRSEYGADMKADNITKTIQRARGDLSQVV